MSEALLNIATASVTLVAFALTLLAGLAWRRTGNTRSALLFSGFVTFLAGGIAASLFLFQGQGAMDVLTLQMLATTIGLLLMYAATVKR